MRILLGLFIFITSISVAKADHDFVIYPEPLHAPTSLFANETGALKTLGNFQNKVVILNFWATWCRPCIVEMPSLNKLQTLSSNLAILPIISSSDDVSKTRSFYRRYKLNELDYFIDETDLTTSSYKVQEVPTSYIFNKQGRLVAYVSGSINWLSNDNVAFIKKLLDE